MISSIRKSHKNSTKIRESNSKDSKNNSTKLDKNILIATYTNSSVRDRQSKYHTRKYNKAITTFH